ncbi:hypothetical protein CF327_g4036 [Tilletia walkeri]|nr:hypothetical protein CF327_g4036 [Tilletia walkeri]
MPYAPDLASSLTSVALSWSSAPLRPSSTPDFFDDLPSLNKWYIAQCKARDLGEKHQLVYSGGQLQHRDELCETADAQKTPPAPKEGPESDTQRPKLLICHDFQGGYNDRFDRRGYTFEYWSLADIFIYFSHRRISCPPVGWNSAANRHGAKMLGTVIFEWKEAIPELSLLLRGPHDSYSPLKPPLRFSPFYIPALIDLALSSNFSGYLINVELPLDLGFSVSGYTWYPDWLRPTSAAEKDEMVRNARRLRAWVALLRSEGRRRFREAGRDEKEWTVLWYDSVTTEGKLEWQDAVTDKNVSFAEVSDGIFTNYTWARPPKPKIEQPDMPGGPAPEESLYDPSSTKNLAASDSVAPYDVDPHPALAHSVAILDRAGRSRSEAYIGIDVFGRNCWGGAQSWRSLDMIGSSIWWSKRLGSPRSDGVASPVADLGLSVALFAPGWTWEHAEPGTMIDPPASSIPIWEPVSEDRRGTERRSWEDFSELDRRFWVGGGRSSTAARLSSSSAAEPHSFKRALSTYFPARAPPSLMDKSLKSSGTNHSAPKVFYHTTFSRGSGTAWYVSGRQVAIWRSTEEPPSTSTAQELGLGDAKSDEARRKEKEALEDRARGRVLAGWTDAGVSLPKPDATWPRPSCVWMSNSTDVFTPPTTESATMSVNLQSGPASVDVELSEDQVWMGNCSLRLRLPSRSEWSSGQALFVPVSWVPLTATSTADSADLIIQATACLHGTDIDTSRVRIGVRFVDGSILQGQSHELQKIPGSSWTRISSTFSITTDQARNSTPHASMEPQAILGVIVHSPASESDPAEVHIGEVYLSLGSGQDRTTSPLKHTVQVERGQDGLFLLTWPEFAPTSHFYEVFAQSESGGRDSVWLGTATRERSRTEFVVSLTGVRPTLGSSAGQGFEFVIRPFGSCWGDAHATGSFTA